MVQILNRAITRYRVIWIYGFLLVIFLSFPVYGSVSLAPILITMAATSLLLVKIIRDGHIHLPFPFIILGIYILYMWILVPTAPLPFSSLNRIWQFVPILLLYLVFDLLIQKKDLTIWENSIIVLVVSACLFEVSLGLLWLAHWIGISENVLLLPPIGYRIKGILLAGSNFTSAFVNLVLPLIAMRFIVAKDRKAKRLWTLILLLILIIEFFSSSRGGWLAGLTAVGATLTFYSYPLWSNTPFKQLPGKLFKWLRTNLVQGLLLIIGITVSVNLFIHQIQTTPGHYGALSGRESIWANSWQIWSQSFYLGHGPGSFPLLYADLANLPPGWMAADAHNLWLNIAVESGLLGLFFALLLVLHIAGIGVRVWESGLSTKEGQERGAVYVGIGVGIFVSNLSAFYFQIPIFTILCLLLLSLIMKLEESKGLTVNKRPGIFIFFLAIFLFAFGSWYISRGALLFEKGSEEFLAGNVSEGLELICDSTLQAPDSSIYQFHCGFVAAQVFSLTGDQRALDKAIQATRAGLALDPYWPVHKANFSILEWQAGERGPAFADMEEAVQRAPENALLAVNLGWMAEQLGYETYARMSYQQALLIDPWLSLSDFFKENQLRQSVVGQFELPEETIALRIAAFLAIKNSDFDSAAEYLRRALDKNPVDAEAIALQALIADEIGADNAWFLAQKSIFLDSENPRTLVWAARIARRAAEENEAISFSQLAFAIWSAKSQHDTDTYYLTVYGPSPFGTSYIPGYVRADVSQEMAEAFLWLADFYRSEGRLVEEQAVLMALRVEGGIDYQSPSWH